MKILLVEDEMKILKLVTFNLNKHGQEVITASNAEDGIKMAIENIPDLILMDIMLPKMNGLDATKIIKENELTKHIPIFMMTAKNKMKDVEDGFKYGADDYIAKPFSVLKLWPIIQSKLEKLQQSKGTN